jgi:sugar phosphate isomerase/epimerase
MPRPVLLYSGAFADLPLEEVAQKASDRGYQGLELCCWGDHFEVQRALSEADYCSQKLELLARYELTVPVLSNHRVGQAVCDSIDARHQPLLPDYVWGDGDPAGVNERAEEEMLATARAAEKMGVGVLGGFTGSPLWSYVLGYPGPTAEVVAEGMQEFVRRWTPILDGCQAAGVRFAFEVHPGQIAFDLYSAETVLDALGSREEFGFLFDPSHLHVQGVDPVEFVRRFGDRLYHVHIKDAALSLNGRSSLLNAYLPSGDVRRGWDFRAPGRGGIDWEGVIRALNHVGYVGPLSVEFKDAGMDREAGAEEACQFVKRLDFAPSPQRPQENQTFR